MDGSDGMNRYLIEAAVYIEVDDEEQAKELASDALWEEFGSNVADVSVVDVVER
jgi:hypothetical protein